jgi:hypothetical protein
MALAETTFRVRVLDLPEMKTVVRAVARAAEAARRLDARPYCLACDSSNGHRRGCPIGDFLREVRRLEKATEAKGVRG